MSAHSPHTVPRLHVITDVYLQGRYSHLELAVMAARGGADLVQVRDKHASDATLRSVTAEVLSGCAAQDVLILLNDRATLAASLSVPGVHLGSGDMDLRTARALLGPGVLLGATANSLSEALVRSQAPIDYLGVGPVFATSSKDTPAAVLGLAGLAEICQATDVPVIAIGGLTPARVADVLNAGAHGVAVLGAVCLAPSPEAATRAFRTALDRALGAPRAR